MTTVCYRSCLDQNESPVFCLNQGPSNDQSQDIIGTLSVPSKTFCAMFKCWKWRYLAFDRKRLKPREFPWQWPWHWWGHLASFMMHIFGVKCEHCFNISYNILLTTTTFSQKLRALHIKTYINDLKYQSLKVCLDHLVKCHCAFLFTLKRLTRHRLWHNLGQKGPLTLIYY